MKTLRDKDHAISELKDKNVKQEKKIDEQTRAKSAKEKDAAVKELKERILYQQKKDDQTRARLATPDSPVVKAVLDATLQENKDLHLRIEAMVAQAQEEKKTVSEIFRMVENYKKELAEAEIRNQALEQELQAAKAETMRIQRQIAHLRDPVSVTHFMSNVPEPSATTDTTKAEATTPEATKLEATKPEAESTTADANKVEATKVEPTRTELTKANTTHTESSPSKHLTSQPQPQPTTPVQTHPPHTPTTPEHTQSTSPHITPLVIPQHNSTEPPVSPRANGINNKGDAGITTSTSSLSPRDELAELESYDLSKLAQELDLDTNDLAPSSSLSDLMGSLDSLDSSPMQALDFISLAQDRSTGSQPATLLSPTARVEMRSPFKADNEYGKDFISMFSPPGNTHVKKVRNNPALNNLFYTEDKSPSPPTFDLAGIDKDFLATNHDELSSPRTSSQPQSPRSQPQSPTSHSFEPTHSPTSAIPPPPFVLHRSSSISPPPHNNHEEYPTTRIKGAHKSIFSVFGNETAAVTDIHSTPTNTPSATSTPSAIAHDELLLSFGAKVDTNKAGLRRAKKVNFAAFSKGKVKVEPTMEDVHFCIYPYMKSKNRGLFAVFDGHAGRAAADEAAALFPKEFNTQLEQASHDVVNAFMKTYAAVDEAMKEYEYMGTTATVVYLWQKGGHKYLQASNVGDSTSFLCRNGVSVRLTVDHKPSAAEERERMKLSGIEVSDNQTRINGTPLFYFIFTIILCYISVCSNHV
jgi:hypothetical protein